VATARTAAAAPKPPATTAAPAPAPAAGPPTSGTATFHTIAGPSCTQSGARWTNVYNDDKGDGWSTASASGWTGDNCGTSFIYTKLANVASDPNEWYDSMEWLFNTGISGGATCTIGVYIPNSSYATALGHYWISNGSTNYDDGIAYFTIDQAAHRGAWLTIGSYHFSGKNILVELDDNGPGTTTIAAADLSVSC
jgi:hypothetical protein